MKLTPFILELFDIPSYSFSTADKWTSANAQRNSEGLSSTQTCGCLKGRMIKLFEPAFD